MSAHEPTVGVIGLRYGRAHIPAFQASGCKVVAGCQRDQAGAKAIADRDGVPRVYGSWEQMLDEARPEIVVIATPPVTHHAMVLQGRRRPRSPIACAPRPCSTRSSSRPRVARGST